MAKNKTPSQTISNKIGSRATVKFLVVRSSLLSYFLPILIKKQLICLIFHRQKQFVELAKEYIYLFLDN